MRDGVHLSADIYRPDTAGRFPGLLVVTPYNNQWEIYVSQAEHFARRGYRRNALVDSRGRQFALRRGKILKANGILTSMSHWMDTTLSSGWASKAGDNGKIGTFGESYVGFTQIMPAPYASPYVKALVPVVNQQSNFGHLYNDGVMQLNVVFTFGLFCSGRTMQLRRNRGIEYNPLLNYDEIFRRLPLITALDDIADLPHIKTWMKHPTYDDYWKSYGVKEKYGDIIAPAYFVSGWYDNLVHEAWRNFKGFREEGGSEEARKGTKILVGFWTHTIDERQKTWAVDFGPNTWVNLPDLHVRWYDYWLKGMQNGVDREAPIRIFVMGANQWRDEYEWPLARTQWRKYYFNSGAKANSRYGDGRLSTTSPEPNGTSDRYVYNPDNPVPTLGGQISTLPTSSYP